MRMRMRMNNIVQDEDEDEEVDEGDLEYGDVLLEELEILENITSCDKVLIFCNNMSSIYSQKTVVNPSINWMKNLRP